MLFEDTQTLRALPLQRMIAGIQQVGSYLTQSNFRQLTTFNSGYLRSVIHPAAVCDRCFTLTIRGAWFHCAHCGKDLCSSCESVDTHDDTHVFLVLKSLVSCTALVSLLFSLTIICIDRHAGIEVRFYPICFKLWTLISGTAMQIKISVNKVIPHEPVICVHQST